MDEAKLSRVPTVFYEIDPGVPDVDDSDLRSNSSRLARTRPSYSTTKMVSDPNPLASSPSRSHAHLPFLSKNHERARCRVPVV